MLFFFSFAVTFNFSLSFSTIPSAVFSFFFLFSLNAVLLWPLLCACVLCYCFFPPSLSCLVVFLLTCAFKLSTSCYVSEKCFSMFVHYYYYSYIERRKKKKTAIWQPAKLQALFSLCVRVFGCAIVSAKRKRKKTWRCVRNVSCLVLTEIKSVVS